MIDHPKRIREDLNYVFEIRRTCFNDKRFRIDGFLNEILNKINKELNS